MDLFENALTRYTLFAISAAVLALLLYLILLAVRALFREARGIAREAGHRPASAALRAVARMFVWAAFFGLFYMFAFFLGKRLGWWAAPAIMVALAAMIWSLLLAERLLTLAPGNVRRHAGTAVTLAGMLGLFVAGVLVAIQS